MLAIKLFHLRVFCALLELLVAGAQLLFTGGLGDAQLVERSVAPGMNVLFIQAQIVTVVCQPDFLAASKDFMTAMLLIPLGEGGGHVHLLNNVAPAHTGVIGAEANLAFLRGVRNYALLGAPQIVVLQCLEPHSS